jgi:hypothetical protein
MRLKELAGVRVRYGYRRLHVLLQREGWQVNVKCVYRLYRLEGLSLRPKTKKKRTSLLRVPMPRPRSALESKAFFSSGIFNTLNSPTSGGRSDAGGIYQEMCPDSGCKKAARTLIMIAHQFGAGSVLP